MIEVFLIVLVVVIEISLFIHNLWRKSQWQTSGKIKEADHARGLAVQLYTRKGYDKSTSCLPVTNTKASRTRADVRVSAQARSSAKS